MSNLENSLAGGEDLANRWDVFEGIAIARHIILSLSRRIEGLEELAGIKPNQYGLDEIEYAREFVRRFGREHGRGQHFSDESTYRSWLSNGCRCAI